MNNKNKRNISYVCISILLVIGIIANINLAKPNGFKASLPSFLINIGLAGDENGSSKKEITGPRNEINVKCKITTQSVSVNTSSSGYGGWASLNSAAQASIISSLIISGSVSAAIEAEAKKLTSNGTLTLKTVEEEYTAKGYKCENSINNTTKCSPHNPCTS
ncbi:MAG: hypothetical protein LBC68_15140 [Prevotellaceae bacterium]|jgi:hypothetical protein|nr:hypothetical protein [Prevotellaceae bacterium]